MGVTSRRIVRLKQVGHISGGFLSIGTPEQARVIQAKSVGENNAFEKQAETVEVNCGPVGSPCR